MIDSLRAEFPSLSRGIGRPRVPVARESPWWGFLSGLGAAFIVGGVMQLASLVVAPYLLPATEPRPQWLTPAAIADAVASVAAGAVLVRSGSIYALLLYVAFELVRVLVSIPGMLQFCERSGFQFGGPPSVQALPGLACDVPSILIGHWPTITALAAGALLAPVLLASAGDGANRMLRAAGAYVLISSAFGLALSVVSVRGINVDEQFTLMNLSTVVQIIAGVAAGLLLARAPFAAALLIVLVIAWPLAFLLRIALQPASGLDLQPPEYTTMRWAAVYIPMLAGAALLTARGYVRRHGGGTFF